MPATCAHVYSSVAAGTPPQVGTADLWWTDDAPVTKAAATSVGTVCRLTSDGCSDARLRRAELSGGQRDPGDIGHVISDLDMALYVVARGRGLAAGECVFW